MKLEDLNYLISTTQPIRLHYPTGENCIAKINDFEHYKDHRVIGLWCRNNELNIELNALHDWDISYENYMNKSAIVLENLMKKYTAQIVELYCKEDSPDDLEDILSYLGISSDILDKYRN